MRDDYDYDKEWARKYILDPLTAPEPNQETGPGSSHLSEYRRSLLQPQSSKPPPPPRQPRGKQPEIRLSRDARSSGGRYPTPPTSASPDRGSFHSSNPFSPAYRRSSFLGTHREEDSPPNSPPLRSGKTPDRAPLLSGPRSPSRVSPPSYTSVVRSSSARAPNPSPLDQDPQRSFSARSRGRGHGHTRSLSGRFPGDMSHRPLDTIKREVRAADRPQHRTRAPYVDTIDALDTIGGGYHHGGPYDATLASRNSNKLYSPLDAVRDTNMEAIRATPREYIQDSLTKHMPLQGTATIPPGAPDMRGRPMRYQEGADLMREPDAPGGAYKRWEGIRYDPDDLKGKGEPSFTFEREEKKKGRLPDDQPAGYEMESGVNGSLRRRGPGGRQRSFSHGPTPAEASSSAHAYADNNDGGLRRNNTTGKRLSDGLKRRFGSLRKKKAMPSEQVE